MPKLWVRHHRFGAKIMDERAFGFRHQTGNRRWLTRAAVCVALVLTGGQGGAVFLSPVSAQTVHEPDFRLETVVPIAVPDPPTLPRSAPVSRSEPVSAMIPLAVPVLPPLGAPLAWPASPVSIAAPADRSGGAMADVTRQRSTVDGRAPVPRSEQVRTGPRDEPAAVPTQVAAAGAAVRVVRPRSFQLLYDRGAHQPGDAGLTRDVVTAVRDMLAGLPSLRIELRAFASVDDDRPASARQLSLQRAMDVRERLAALGIRRERVNLRALGLAAEGPPDRIDIVPLAAN